MGMTPGQEPLGYAAQSVAGRVRDHNEDALLCRPALGLWAVADGMGGHSCGEVASAIALETLERELAAGLPLEVAVHGANRAVLEAAAGLDDERRGMGTTLVAVRFQGSDFELAWVGDSRAYRIDAAGIHQISRDHSWVQALVDAGQMTPSRRAPMRGAMSSPSAWGATTRPWKSACSVAACSPANCCCCAATASAASWTTRRSMPSATRPGRWTVWSIS